MQSKSVAKRLAVQQGPVEDICLQCGRCCYHCSVSEDKLVRTDVPCKYLNTVSHLCEKYLDRFWLDVVCLTIQEATRQRVLPSDCPYVADVADYEGPEEVKVGAED